MPLARISFTPAHDKATQQSVGDNVYEAMRESIGIPENDRFQLFRQSGDIVYDRGYLGIERSEKFVLIEIIMRRGRTIEQKQTLFRRIAERLETLGIPKADVMVTLTENGAEDWSFGDGIAQYVR